MNISYTHSESYTSTEGKEDTYTNPTGAGRARVAYGIFSDVFALQEAQWQTAWYPEGAQIFVGDDKESFATLYKVKKEGCYRTADFSRVEFPAAEGIGVVERFGEIECTHRIWGTGVQAYPPKVDPDTQEEEPDQSEDNSAGNSEDKKPKRIDLEGGRCVKIAAYGVEGSQWIQLNKAARDPVTGVCESTEELCKEHYWVKTEHIKDQAAKPAPLTAWGDGTSLALRPRSSPEGYLHASESFGADRFWLAWAPNVPSYRPASWTIVTSGDKWQIKQDVNEDSIAGCMGVADDTVIRLKPCEDTTNTTWTITSTGAGAEFYLKRAINGVDHCAEASGNNVVKFAPCDADNFQHRWVLGPAETSPVA